MGRLLLSLSVCIALAGVSSSHAAEAGSVIEYEVLSPQYLESPTLDPDAEVREHPGHLPMSLNRTLFETVEAWNERHAPQAGVAGKLAWAWWLQPTEAERAAQWPRPDWRFLRQGRYAVFLATGDTALAADLRSALAALDGVTEVAHEPLKGYFERRHPDLFGGDKTITVDGVIYRFPDDFNAEEVQHWMGVLLGGNPPGMYYLDYFVHRPDIRRRMNLGHLSLVTRTGAGVAIKTILPADDPANPMTESYSAGISRMQQRRLNGEVVTEERTPDEAYRILISLAQKNQRLDSEFQIVEGWQLVYLLYPLELWRPGQPDAAYETTPEQDARAERLFNAYKAVVDEFIAENQGLVTLSPAKNPIRPDVVFRIRDSLTETFGVRLITDESVLQRLREQLDAVAGGHGVVVARLPERQVDPATGELRW